MVLYYPLLVLASAFYLLALLPSWLLFPVPLRALVVGLVNWMVKSPGDQCTLMYNRASMESVKKRLIDLRSPTSISIGLRGHEAANRQLAISLKQALRRIHD